MKSMGLFDKVRYICKIANANGCTQEQKEDLLALVKEHSNEERLGKVFGFSVSDFAIACFKWIGDEDEFNNLVISLDENRKLIIQELVASNMYTQLA